MVKVFNRENLLQVYPKFPVELFEKLSQEENINIIFVDEKFIQRLNKEYREKNYATDVLSFSFEEDEILGEIYICPEYVYSNISKRKFVEEILRLSVHGLLHLRGYNHTKDFDEIDYKEEPMYIKQEEILHNILNK